MWPYLIFAINLGRRFKLNPIAIQSFWYIVKYLFLFGSWALSKQLWMESILLFRTKRTKILTGWIESMDHKPKVNTSHLGCSHSYYLNSLRLCLKSTGKQLAGEPVVSLQKTEAKIKVMNYHVSKVFSSFIYVFLNYCIVWKTIYPKPSFFLFLCSYQFGGTLTGNNYTGISHCFNLSITACISWWIQTL